jgi:4-hydroxymandelate oxidase
MTDKFVTLPEIRKHAKKLLPRDAWNFGDGGARPRPPRRNHRAINRLAIRQTSSSTSARSTSDAALGCAAVLARGHSADGRAHPVPSAGRRRDGPRAAQGDTLQFLSARAAGPVEDVAKASPGPKMFQLYHHGDRAWAADLIARVEAPGTTPSC